MSSLPIAEFTSPSSTRLLKSAERGESLVFPCSLEDVHKLNKTIQISARNLGIEFETSSYTGISNSSPKVACSFLVFTVLEPYFEKEKGLSRFRSEPVEVEYSEDLNCLINAMPLETKVTVGKRMLAYGLTTSAVKSVLGLSDRAHSKLLARKKKSKGIEAK
jgi:hypothetical protein